METPRQRAKRIAQLEQNRAARHNAQTTVWPTPDDAGTGVLPITVAPGRGDLQYSSGFVPTFPTALYLVGMRAVSFARLFMSQPWVASAVMRMLTWSIRVPLKVYRRDGDDPADRTRLRPGEHPLATALEGNDRMSQAQLIMALLGPVLVHGNSVTEAESGANDALLLTPKDWRFCRPLMPFRDTVDGFQFDVDTDRYRREVSVDDVLHIAYWSPTGPIGVSPLQQLGVTLQIEDAAQRAQRAIFANGMRQSSMLVASEAFMGLDPAEREVVMKQLRDSVTELFAGPDNSGRPLLLPAGLDYKPAGQSMAEADLIEQRKITREEVAAVYLIPPPLIGILDKATYSNISTQRDMTYTDCLGPPLVLIEQCLNAQLVRNLLGETDVFAEFDFAAVLRGDPLEEIAALRDAIGTALLTPNEGRGILNRQKSTDPGMDRFYLPFNNLQPVGSPPINPLQMPGPNQQPGQSPLDPSPPAKRLHVRSRDRDYELVPG